MEKQQSTVITVQHTEISIAKINKADYISLTDMAKYRNRERSDHVIQNWMRNYNTIEFLGLWERFHNPDVNPLEIEGFKNRSGSNSFVLTPKQWIEATNAKGMVSKAGRYGGGTYAHKYIAFEFATWLSAEFKFYLIHEFDRLKLEESNRMSLDWDLRRTISKINFRIHTDAIKTHIVPPVVTKKQVAIIYASETDMLNVALFGMTAAEWRLKNQKKAGNIRDDATLEQLVVLSNMESINAHLIKQGLNQGERLMQLNQVAITQMTSLLGNAQIRRISGNNKDK